MSTIISDEELDHLREALAENERLRKALSKIGDLESSEDDFEPLDEAISIARRALTDEQGN